MAAVRAEADMDRPRSFFRVVPIADIEPLLNHLVGTGEKEGRNFHAERLRGLEIDD